MSCYSDDIAPPIHRVCPTASEGGSPTLSAGGTSALPPPARAPLSAGLGARCTARSHAFSPPARAPLSAGQGARYAARCRARRPLAQGARCDARARRLLELAGAVLRIGDAAPAPLLQARAAAGAAPRAASVFCGGGGSGLGLEAAGFDVVLGIDNSAKALLCFKRNHPRARALNVSVASVLRCAAALRAANVVLADCSAPCQGWSTAGHQRAGDTRNQLTVRAAEVFALVRVPIVLFENVPRSQRSPEWKLACDKLRAAGYSIDTALVDASRLGVPQRRVRMFAVATQPGFGFDLAGPAKVVANSARTCVADVMPGRRHFYHLGRGKRDPCVFSSTVPSPTLRTNCDYHPGLRHRRRARDSAHIRETSPFSLADLRLLQGWPASSFLPERRRDAARILGNSVAPPVAAWLGSLARNAITAASSGVAAASARVAAAIRTPADLRFFQGAARLGWGKRALERFHTIQAAQRGWGHGAVQRMIEAKDASVPGAHTGPLPGTADPHVLRVHSRVPDTDAAFGAMHVQQMKRRERRRLSLLLRQHIASDGTLRDLMDPIWAGPPAGAPPSSANPPAHWGAKPWRLCDTLGDTASLPTHRSAVSACSRNFQAMHMAHCARCAAHSTAVHGHAPPIAALRSAFRTGCIPCSSAWTLDPGCYQREMIEEIRVGLSPPLDPAPPAVAVPNGGSCWNEWDQTIAYIEKTDAIGAFDAGVWRLPKGAVCSAMHMVTRASDRRALARDGTPCPVRSVTDLTASGVNNGLPRWPFRMPSVDDAVHLIGRFPEGKCYLGATDLSKFFPSLGLGPSMQRYCWIRDPRADTTWRGDGPPSASWLRWQAKRRRTGKRYPPYRRCSGVPLGIRVAPPFACGVSGEIVCFLTSIGLHASMYVDDMFCAAATAAQCKRDMDTAGAVFRWLGLRCNDEKQQGPARALDYLGLVVDTVAQTVTISTDRRLDLLSDVGRILSASTFGSKDLESVIGKLGFAAQVIRGGKAYLQRLRLALNAALKSSSSSVAIDAEARADASWWHAKLSDPVQGSRIFLTDAPVPVVTLKSDASGVAGRGWGYVLDGVLHWSRWHTDSVDANHMQYKEMIAIIHCMEEYGPHFANRIMRVGVDNSGVAYATNKMSSKCPLLMRLLRRLADLQCAHNSDTIAVHVSRQYNTLADLASRFAQLDEFVDELPAGVAAPSEDRVSLCRAASPADSEPVFKLRLAASSTPASTRARPPPTTGASASSSTTATPWATPASSATSPSPTSTRSTSLASPATSSSAPGPRSPSSRPLSPTSPCFTGCTGPALAPTSAYASTSRASSRSTRTTSSATTRSSPSSCSASPVPSASAAPVTLIRATSAPSSSGRAPSPPTPHCSAPASTRAACSGATSSSAAVLTAASSLSSPLAGGAASASSSTAPASCRFLSSAASCPLGTCSASSPAASTTAAPTAPLCSLTAPPASPSPTSACPGNGTASALRPCAAAWALSAPFPGARCAPAARQTSSPSVPQTSSSSTRAAG
jgi:DNA (cytosine-5)-methyltransferase 1